MALYRRGRVWYADFYVHGKRVQESTGTANRREAESSTPCESQKLRGAFTSGGLIHHFPTSASDTSRTPGIISVPGSAMSRC